MKKVVVFAISTFCILFSLFSPVHSFAYAKETKQVDSPQSTGTVQQTENTPHIIRIAGGNPFGLRFSVAGAICSFINLDTTYDCSTVPVKNSKQSLLALKEKRVRFALVQSDWLLHAKDGTSRFYATGKEENLRAIAIFNPEVIVVVVKKDASIEKISDLKGKTFEVGEENTYRNLVVNTIFDAMGVSLSTVKKNITSQKTSIKNVCEGKSDGAIFIVPIYNQTVDKIMARCDVKILSLSAQEKSQIQKKLKGFYPAYIPKETYWGQEKKIDTLGIYTVLVTTKDVSSKDVQYMYSQVRKNIRALASMHPALVTLNTEDPGKFTPIQFHSIIDGSQGGSDRGK